ncbi:MAG: PepSY-associated TM helix domain-containing protein [Chryseolinea sp.]
MKEQRRTFKYWIGRIHLWLGLGSGLIIFIIAITGCIYAFQAEIQDMLQPYRFVEIQDKPMLQPTALKEIGERILPGKKMHGILYAQPGHAAQISYYDIEYYYIAYINPYSGEVLEISDHDASFFAFILDGHFYLWLPVEIGRPVVASATLIFLVMMISGLVLWWPKKKGATKQRFSIKWNARWRRKNYDLHNVLGFYATWIAIILAVTGLVWGFDWFANGLHKIAGGERSLVYSEPESDTSVVALHTTLPIDNLYQRMRAEYPTAPIIEIHIPSSSSTSIEVAINHDDETYWQTDYRYFDQYSLKEYAVDHIYGRQSEASFGDKLIRMNYDIHTGAVLGLAGKFIAFFASLIIASLPITGFYIWWGRKKKEKEKQMEKLQRRHNKVSKGPAKIAFREPVGVADVSDRKISKSPNQ